MDHYILEMREITKQFPGVRALDKVDFKARKGEIHALCGENGAGKSTLMKVLSGVYPYGTYQGEILLNGQPQKFYTIKDSERAGIAIIYQELALVSELSVAENIFLGNEPVHHYLIDWDKMYMEAAKWLKEVGLEVSPGTKIKNLGVGQQQLVEIAKALVKNASILVLDEPTAALTDSEVEILMGILRQLKSKGVTCIYISHKLNEVFAIADNITVLRDGRTIGTVKKDETNQDKIISMMVGRELNSLFPSTKHSPGAITLEVRNFSVYSPDNPRKKIVKDVSFYVRRGEILGIAGLIGSGRTELVTSIYGGYPGKNEGEIWLDGKKVKIKNCEDALSNRIALVPEDRRRQGLVLDMDIRRNITLASLKRSYNIMLNESAEIRDAEFYVDKLKIKTPSVEACVGNLSGGNQQKVVLAKAMMTKPRVLILDEPTRGIDVGAKYEIYNLINSLVSQGVAIVMVSSELPEILGMSDRILVLCEGRITGEFSREEATEEKIMACATGGKASA
ncbi:xylose import ATP-binding protein XylG [Moorella sp. E308F]|uniref:xylose ABC transporter ATP-binding protein n=1 Tax=Moorella sp. E308F TaxID=2572682 RepID=UPI0010FFBB86|nr:xylose ABC transporter ATP-binding protein [Moorella sp. E308F]GEA13965.1 xylose import ATP-binding protein XylG [Moorella sp. E308F]